MERQHPLQKNLWPTHALELNEIQNSLNCDPYFGSGSGSTVLTPGKIVEVALNFL